MKSLLLTGLLLLCQLIARAGTTGSISGTLTDPTGAVIPGARLTATNSAQGIQYKTTSDAKGAYTLPSLPVGKYDLRVEARGFKPQNRAGLTVDLDSLLRIDGTLELAEKF